MIAKRKVVAIIAAAGQGIRMRSSVNKQRLTLHGLPVITRSVMAFEVNKLVDQIIVVLHPEEIPVCPGIALEPYSFRKIAAVIPGGESRADSVMLGLNHVTGCSAAAADAAEQGYAAAMGHTAGSEVLVLIHDGARPLISQPLITSVIEAASEFGAAVPVVPVNDTIKVVSQKGIVLNTPARDSLVAVQTPQAFRADWIISAYDHVRTENIAVTDDASACEAVGRTVVTVPGESSNIKITGPNDLLIAEHLLSASLHLSGEEGHSRSGEKIGISDDMPC